jgi:hypothetical protein
VRQLAAYVSSEGSITQAAWDGMNATAPITTRIKTLQHLHDVAM